MCGIAGILHLNQNINRKDLADMCKALEHRGPDDHGIWIDHQNQIGFGHQRLAIIDLSAAGHQPMSAFGLTITFNGEIYNYQSLRKQLINLGFHFQTQSDTEVLLAAYRHWGPKMLQHLVGMWAFAIWDEQSRQLFAARDRFGIKPFYYQHRSHESLVFASELKGLLALDWIKPTLSMSAVADYLYYRYVPSPHTIWQGIHKLPPAHYLLWENNHLKINCYWQPEVKNDTVSPIVLKEEIAHLLEATIRDHQVADVPVGLFLSGGYDSSAIAWLLSRIQKNTQAFSIGFENWDRSEHPFAAIAAQTAGIQLHTEVLPAHDWNITETLAQVYDEPLADISVIPTYRVSALARKHLKVVMGGEGSDEIFSGYHWHYPLPPYSWHQRLKSKWLKSKHHPVLNHYAQAMWMGKMDRFELKQAFTPDFHQVIPEDSHWFFRSHLKPEYPPLKMIQWLDMKCFMGELVLTKVDRASMAHGLEVRVPFLHHELFERIFTLDTNCYYQTHQPKWLLYEQLKSVMPEAILKRKKQGFVGPDHFYMQHALYRRFWEDSILVKEGILNADYVANLAKETYDWRWWKWWVLEQWYRRWIREN